MAQPTDTEWPSEPRTLLKHQIYKRYVDCWMGKILQAFPSASIVDAFAGPGGYSDGPDGSSLVIAKAFLNHTGRERFRTLRLICNEARADRNEALARRLAALPTDARLKAFVIDPASTFEAAISIIERRAHPRGEPLPTLWLLDPFDVKSVPFDLVARCLGGARDEILLSSLLTRSTDSARCHRSRSPSPPTMGETTGGRRWPSPESTNGRLRSCVSTAKAWKPCRV